MILKVEKILKVKKIYQIFVYRFSLTAIELYRILLIVINF